MPTCDLMPMLPFPLSHPQIRQDGSSTYTRVLIYPQVIEKDTKVRLKVVGTRVDQTEIVSIYHSCLFNTDALQFAIATIKEDHLGVID